jgi:hypothetical protein
MEVRSNLFSGGFHAMADVVIATSAALGAVLICYPMYIAVVVVKAAVTKSTTDARIVRLTAGLLRRKTL